MDVIESVDLYYLSMPHIEAVGDGSQDVLLVRVRAGDWEGWGECEASPLVSIASLVAPMSHSACQPVEKSIIGEALNDLNDVHRINAKVRANSFDQLQAAHTLSGIDIALCDLLGRRYEVPVYELLGVTRPTPKTPYASVLFGETPDATYDEAQRLAGSGFRAVKFGWMGFGSDLETDFAQLEAAREGLGDNVDLLVDAAMAWSGSLQAALDRLPSMEKFGVRFIEEPFVAEEYEAYGDLARRAKQHGIAVAGGERCHNARMAIAMMQYADLDYVQIDAGRIGGITSAKEVADAASASGRVFINHTFTSHLALSASLQPYADHEWGGLCEYPINSKPVSYDITREHIDVDADGLVHLPDAPGLGLTPNPAVMAEYLVDVEIQVDGRVLYKTPKLDLTSQASGKG